MHLNSEHQQAHYLFLKIFCKSRIFDEVLNLIEKRMINIFGNRHYMNEQEKEKYDKDKKYEDLFALVVLAFEIIENCRVITYPNCRIHKIMQNSVNLIG